MNPPSPVRINTSADEMRRQRNLEAKELIGSRVDTAKAIFTQNSAVAQMSNQKAAPIKPIRNSIAQRINTLNNQQQQHLPSYSFATANTVDVETNAISMQPVENITTLPESPSIACDKSETSGKIDQNIQSAEQPIAPISNQAPYIPDDDDSDPYSTIKRSPYTKTGSTSQVTSPETEEMSASLLEASTKQNGNSSAKTDANKNDSNDDLHTGKFEWMIAKFSEAPNIFVVRKFKGERKLLKC